MVQMLLSAAQKTCAVEHSALLMSGVLLLSAAAPTATAATPSPPSSRPPTRVLIKNGYLLPTKGGGGGGTKKALYVGTNWSQVQTVVDRQLPEPGPLPGNVADDQTMRYLDLLGVYVADVPLQVPSRVHVRISGNITGGQTTETQRTALLSLDKAHFVTVTGGVFDCAHRRSIGITADHSTHVLIQNNTYLRCTPDQGGAIRLVAVSVVEVQHIVATNCSRGVWTERAPISEHHDPIQKVLVANSFFSDCHYCIDLDAMSTDVMVKGNRLQDCHQAAIYLEEGAKGNFVLDNQINITHGHCGICMFSNFAGYKHGHPPWPVANNWVVGNRATGRGLYTDGISLSSRLAQDAASGNVFFDNTISTALKTWSGSHAVGTAVMTSTIGNDRESLPRGQNNSFLSSPDPLLSVVVT